MSHTPVPALASALTAALAEIEPIDKDGRNTQQGYAFTSEANIANTIRPIMAKHGLSLAPTDITVTSERIIETRNSKMQAVSISAGYMLLHKSGEWMTLRVPGEGMDSLDKAIPKALTMAYKYAMIQLFCIGRGDDPDAGKGYDAGDDPPPARVDNSAARVKTDSTEDAGDFVIMFGTKYKNRKLSTVDNGYLDFLISEFFPPQIEDKSKANFKADNLRKLNSCLNEKQRRAENARLDAEIVANDEEPPF